MRTELCDICRDNLTDISCTIVNTDSGSFYNETIYVCKKCLDDALDTFIFICVTCRTVYKSNKKKVITEKLKDNENPELTKAFIMLENEQIIIGISDCIGCNKDNIVSDYFEKDNGGISGHA